MVYKKELNCFIIKMYIFLRIYRIQFPLNLYFTNYSYASFWDIYFEFNINKVENAAFDINYFNEGWKSLRANNSLSFTKFGKVFKSIFLMKLLKKYIFKCNTSYLYSGTGHPCDMHIKAAPSSWATVTVPEFSIITGATIPRCSVKNK